MGKILLTEKRKKMLWRPHFRDIHLHTNLTGQTNTTNVEFYKSNIFKKWYEKCVTTMEM